MAVSCCCVATDLRPKVESTVASQFLSRSTNARQRRPNAGRRAGLLSLAGGRCNQLDYACISTALGNQKQLLNLAAEVLSCVVRVLRIRVGRQLIDRNRISDHDYCADVFVAEHATEPLLTNS